MATERKKWVIYTPIICAAIQSVFDENSENYIDPKELEDDNNLTEFLHALANAAPTHIFNQITGDKKNHLEFNHIANRLCFQYMRQDYD